MAVKTKVLSAEEAEARQAALQKADATQARRDGPDLQPQKKLDADLAPLADPTPMRPVSRPRRRRPHEIPLVLVGNRKGMLHDQRIDVVVPDEENKERVEGLADVVDPGMDKEGNPNPPVSYADWHMSGPSYHFTRGEATLVEQEDLPFLLAHKRWKFERADQVQDQAAPAARSRRTG